MPGKPPGLGNCVTSRPPEGSTSGLYKSCFGGFWRVLAGSWALSRTESERDVLYGLADRLRVVERQFCYLPTMCSVPREFSHTLSMSSVSGIRPRLIFAVHGLV